MDTMLLAHYYAPEEIKDVADYVGDSLGLIQEAQKVNPKRLVFAGVRFMAETAKVMLPDTEVIIPDYNATCSLVEQTNIHDMTDWVKRNSDATHVMYINSSVEMKALADIIVTSANVNAIIEAEIDSGNRVIFSPDLNMGRYINKEFGYEMPIWNSVCEVHDQFNLEALERDMRGWTDGGKSLIAHPESGIDILDKADFVGSTSKMLEWVENYPYDVSTIWVATEEGLLNDMRKLRPSLDFRLVPGYKGCMCSTCPYMKLNTKKAVYGAILGFSGTIIDYISDDLMEKARKPIERMLEFSK